MTEATSSPTTKQALVIERIFDAPRELVWKAFTEPERMRQWWGPKGFTVIASTMDLRLGGTYHYGLRGPDGSTRVAAAVGTGPVDAAFRAIDGVVQRPATLVDYSVRSVTEGIDALAEVSVRVVSNDNGTVRPLHPQHEASPEASTWRGHGADTDIVVASVKAYLAALNRMVAATVAFRGVTVAAEEVSGR